MEWSRKVRFDPGALVIAWDLQPRIPVNFAVYRDHVPVRVVVSREAELPS